MGSWLSGRRPEKVTVESCLVLDLAKLLRNGTAKPGAEVTATLIWTRARTGETRAILNLVADMTAPEGAFVRLRYEVSGKHQDYRVWLRRAPCRFGGFRWWWRCPRTGHDCAKLYLPPGGTMFLSRRAYRMAYHSERGGPIDRSHNRQERAYAKLGADYRHFEQCPPKRPKGMHHKTYERLVSEIEQAIDKHNVIFIAGAARILRKDPAMRERLGLASIRRD